MTREELVDTAQRMQARHRSLEPYSRDIVLLCDLILALAESLPAPYEARKTRG